MSTLDLEPGIMSNLWPLWKLCFLYSRTFQNTYLITSVHPEKALFHNLSVNLRG